ncbi:MAG: hypothetical protein R3C05_02560 [Pirellulaceae bacterium]
MVQQLNETDFDRDYRDLFNDVTGPWAERMIEVFQSLEPDEVETLLSKIDNKRLIEVLRNVYLARENDSSAATGHIWYQAVRGELEAWLQSMARAS